MATFYNWYSFMQKKPHMAGSSIMVEFSYVGYFFAFESILISEADGQQVLVNWKQACRGLHPENPRFSLYSVYASNPIANEWQAAPTSPNAFEFIGAKFTDIFTEVREQAPWPTALPIQVSTPMLAWFAELVERYLQPKNFFWHKAKAYEAFVLSLMLTYEYLLRGSFDDAVTAKRWRAEVDKQPCSATRTLADVYTTQQQIVEQSQLFTFAEAQQSFAQVAACLRGLLEKTKFIHNATCRQLLGFPSDGDP